MAGSSDGPARHRHAAPDPADGTPGTDGSPPRSRWKWSGDHGDEAGPPSSDLAVAAAMPPSSSSVRPYFFTRGRTRSAVHLEIETLVSVVPGVVPPPGPALVAFELCLETRSVAEVAALMRVPLGVARVLLGDLAGTGAVVVHETVSSEGPALALMQRVLTGLRNL